MLVGSGALGEEGRHPDVSGLSVTLSDFGLRLMLLILVLRILVLRSHRYYALHFELDRHHLQQKLALPVLQLVRASDPILTLVRRLASLHQVSLTRTCTKIIPANSTALAQIADPDRYFLRLGDLPIDDKLVWAPLPRAHNASLGSLEKRRE